MRPVRSRDPERPSLDPIGDDGRGSVFRLNWSDFAGSKTKASIPMVRCNLE